MQRQDLLCVPRRVETFFGRNVELSEQLNKPLCKFCSPFLPL